VVALAITLVAILAPEPSRERGALWLAAACLYVMAAYTGAGSVVARRLLRRHRINWRG
jgi:hypothetical protein